MASEEEEVHAIDECPTRHRATRLAKQPVHKSNFAMDFILSNFAMDFILSMYSMHF